jgi:hypothetical protein
MAELALRSLRDTIDEKIAGSGPAVLERVIKSFVDAEQDRRAKILVNGVNALRELESDLNKINRGDVVHYSETGVPIGSAAFTKERVTAIKKAKDKILKLEFALTKALSEHVTTEDFSKLEKAIKSKGETPKDNDED